MPHRRWFVHKTNPEYIRYLSKTASISPAFAQILVNRGIKTSGAALSFMDPGVSRLDDPLKIPNMKRAAEVIMAAINSNRRILVHGDYDTDGITGTAIMITALKRLGADVVWFIPERMHHGYGFNRPGVDYARGAGAGLIITVDCGITSFEAVKASRGAGMAVVITDHHELMNDVQGNPVLPDADAVVNPHLGSEGPAPISGSAVSFKLASVLLGAENALDLMDLASLGTIADVVPLINDSRIIVREGLKLINEGTRMSIAAMRDVAGLNGKTMTACLLSFTLIPRLNAAGRIKDAGDAVRLLLSDDNEEALSIAGMLNDMNLKRQTIEEEIQQEALSLLNEKGFNLSIVLASEGWHEGVIGIVASRIAESFYRPAFVFTVKDGIAKGSARSIPPFDLYRGISECRDILLSFGGHRQAAGLRLKAEDLSEFEERMNQIVARTLRDEDLTPLLTIDASVNLREVDFRLVREIELLEPLGYGNPEPLFGTKDAEVVEPRIVGNNHLKMRLRQRSSTIDAIGFDMGGLMEAIESSRIGDAVYLPTINEWEGGRTLQLQLRAFRPSV